ncbi:hypothetical protein O3M35_009869 [Rhynocoris fuscipes]|uniref:Uncharacterized protein n=1 Tax=Rhynocoris fuscipes TaxID=488301 RepID=A0AAW1D585_9HEMI
MRLNYLESENGNSTCNSATINSKSSKLSKWHRVKGALGWEKDKDDMLKVPNSSSDSPFSLSPSGSCLSHSSIGTHYTLPVIPHLSSSSSDEELHVQGAIIS